MTRGREAFASVDPQIEGVTIGSAYDAHGPTPHDDGTATFAVWAPRADRVRIVLDSREHPLETGADGWHRSRLPATAGARYAYRLDGGPPRPDPASRHQPEGVHEASALVATHTFDWSATEPSWQPPPLAGAVIYELHIGAFTDEGTFAAAAGQLDALPHLGVTHVEVMPVNAFNGERNWGYDGVGWYAVHEPYGGPEGFAAFVDACHRAGLAVLLDAVYNHLGPSGNYLPDFGPYLAEDRASTWGEGINLDGAGSDAVRAFIVGSALTWLRDYHVDGLRLDAVHALVDLSAIHVLAELADAVTALSIHLRKPHLLIAESDRNDPLTITSRSLGGLGMDGQWADDLHHAIHTAVTGERDGYYMDYAGLPDVAAAYTGGFVYDGGRYSPYRGRHVGAPLGPVPSHRLVACVQNHDQVGNRATGERLTGLVDDALVRVAVVLLCAAPHTPMLFMGEEYGETRPFQFFTSHPEPELAEAVRRGRAEEFVAFASWRGQGAQGEVPDPQDPGTFARSRLDRATAETDEGRARRGLWTDLLHARRSHDALANGRRDLIDVLHVTPEHLVLVRRSDSGPAILLLVNLSPRPATLPLAGGGWTPLLDTNEPQYGGDGYLASVNEGSILVPSSSAALWIADSPTE